MNSYVETFFPYNQLKSHILVSFVELKKTKEAMFSDIMTVEYKNKEYDLVWDDYHSQYTGEINGIEGFIP